jgi:acetyl esterase/lipase
MKPSRRALIGGLALAGGAPVAARAAEAAAGALYRPGEQIIPLWPSTPPGGGGQGLALQIANQARDPSRLDRWVSGIAQPALVYRPAPRPNGVAVLLVPGGGYGFLAYDNEGLEQAAWLNARGISCYVLMYRLPAEGWGAGPQAPLQDAQRAVRVIRARAEQDGIDPERVVVLGFSAGGHLAGSLALHHAQQAYAPVDALDARPARPDLVAMIYPVVTMLDPYTHPGSREKLLGPNASLELQRQYSLELQVNGDAPPIFLVHAGDDDFVPTFNTLNFYAALRRIHDPAELHIFGYGGHGFGVRRSPAFAIAQWPDLFTTWVRSNLAVP